MNLNLRYCGPSFALGATCAAVYFENISPYYLLLAPIFLIDWSKKE